MRSKKKVILLICDTERRFEEIRFILTVRGFSVVTSAEETCNGRTADAAMIVQSLVDRKSRNFIRKSVTSVHVIKGIPVLLLSDIPHVLESSLSVNVFIADGEPVVEWLGRLKILSARKRGPKTLKGITRKAA